jgi:hypothetical protein
MMIKIVFYALAFFLLVSSCFAIPFVPQGDIELRGVYGLRNATSVNATRFNGNSTWRHLAYPSSCSAGYAITQLGDSSVCSLFLGNNTGSWSVNFSKIHSNNLSVNNIFINNSASQWDYIISNKGLASTPLILIYDVNAQKYIARSSNVKSTIKYFLNTTLQDNESVLFKNGVYKITDDPADCTFVIQRENVVVSGEGFGTIFHHVKQYDGMLVAGLFCLEGNYSYFGNMQLIGNTSDIGGAVNGTGDAVKMIDSTSHHNIVENLRLEGWYSGIAADEADDSLIHNIFSYQVEHAIQLNDVGGFTVRNIYAESSDAAIGAYGQEALKLINVSNSEFSNIHCKQTQRSCVDVFSAVTDSSFNGIYDDDSSDTSYIIWVYKSGSKNLVFTNVFLDKRSVYLQSADNFEFSNIFSNGSVGFSFDTDQTYTSSFEHVKITNAHILYPSTSWGAGIVFGGNKSKANFSDIDIADSIIKELNTTSTNNTIAIKVTGTSHIYNLNIRNSYLEGTYGVLHAGTTTQYIHGLDFVNNDVFSKNGVLWKQNSTWYNVTNFWNNKLNNVSQENIAGTLQVTKLGIGVTPTYLLQAYRNSNLTTPLLWLEEDASRGDVAGTWRLTGLNAFTLGMNNSYDPDTFIISGSTDLRDPIISFNDTNKVTTYFGNVNLNSKDVYGGDDVNASEVYQNGKKVVDVGGGQVIAGNLGIFSSSNSNIYFTISRNQSSAFAQLKFNNGSVDLYSVGMRTGANTLKFHNLQSGVTGFEMYRTGRLVFYNNTQFINITDGTLKITGGDIKSADDVNVTDLHASNLVRIAPIASPPANALEGMIYVDSSHALCWYNSSAWQKISGGGTCS